MTSLESSFPGLWATPSTRLPYQANVFVRSFILERADGNVAIYNSPGLGAAAELGAVSRLLINHGHEEMYGDSGIDAEVWVHERDRREAARTLTVAGVFTGRTMIGNDLEVIPTPGHTPGTTSYLWANEGHRFLFTGDFIWVEEGEWKAVVLGPSGRADYLDSLRLVRDLDFDVLVPWGTTVGDPYAVSASRDQIRERIDAIIARVEAGGSR